MIGAVVRLPVVRRGLFVEPKEGELRFCGACKKDRHVHPVVSCSQCGDTFRACPRGVNATGFSACDEHRGGVRR